VRPLDINRSYSRAEVAFSSGDLELARRELESVLGLAGDNAAVLHLLALVESRSGNLAEAQTAFARALGISPDDATLHNNYANLLSTTGQVDLALHHYGTAVALDASYADARLNRALMLQKLQRHSAALEDLDAAAAMMPQNAKVHSAMGASLLALERFDDAAEAFERALAIDPRRRTALHGRARVALESGDDRPSAYFTRALAVLPGDPTLHIGRAEALEVEGRVEEGIQLLVDAVQAQPLWVEGHQALARMLWEAGRGRAFTQYIEAALVKAPAHVRLWTLLVTSLANADLHSEAADAAKRGRASAGDAPELLLLEAVNASEAGDLNRASELFDRVPPTASGRDSWEARHRIRLGEYGIAESLLERVRSRAPWDVAAWALTGLVWRVEGDRRSDWLLSREFVRCSALGLTATELEDVAGRLRSLHRTRAHPIGQSLRGGTQTRGQLLSRKEPEIQRLRQAIQAAVDDYWSALPESDPGHPLLRHRDRNLAIRGSWSVRLMDGGFHVSHIHPRGALSSACYFAVPASVEPLEGWLEVGGAPANLNLELEPVRRIEPAPGRIALFPSYMFHGTRPFAVGERLTAAFDVIVA
jgi:Tfp pilus assembly protein PilF